MSYSYLTASFFWSIAKITTPQLTDKRQMYLLHESSQIHNDPWFAIWQPWIHRFAKRRPYPFKRWLKNFTTHAIRKSECQQTQQYWHPKSLLVDLNHFQNCNDVNGNERPL